MGQPIPDYNIDHKEIATHFKKSNESMRQLKRKFERGEQSLWTVYLKAYNFDKGIENGK